VARLGGYGPEAPKATGRLICKGVKAAVKKKVGFGRGGQIRGYGPEAAKATGRPTCKGSCKEKGWVSEGWPD
jgi:hypothetical protein